jgi:hypothetical protein
MLDISMGKMMNNKGGCQGYANPGNHPQLSYVDRIIDTVY